MIFRVLSRLIILVLSVVVLAELVSKDEPEQSKPKDETKDAEAEAEPDEGAEESEGDE